MLPNRSELFAAIDRANRKAITRLIAARPNLETTNEAGDTPLLYAIRKQRHGVVLLLLEAGADPNHAARLSPAERRERGKQIKLETPLSLAAAMTDVVSIDALLKHGADIRHSSVEAAACHALFFGSRRAKRIVLRLLEAGLNPKSSWKGVRLYRIAEHENPEVVAKLQALGEVMKTKQERAVPPPVSGGCATDFISFIHGWGHPEWIVLAVEAPIDRVSALLAAEYSAKERRTDVPVRVARKKDNAIAPLVTLVQSKDSAWTVILRILCLPIDMPDWTVAEHICEKISKKLKARALAFMGEDTSFAMSYTLYKSGRKMGSKGWESQTDSADDAFEALGLYLPACYPRREENTIWVCALDASFDRIDRADVVDLGRV